LVWLSTDEFAVANHYYDTTSDTRLQCLADALSCFRDDRRIEPTAIVFLSREKILAHLEAILFVPNYSARFSRLFVIIAYRWHE
jgi:hypothetical protein